MRSAHRSTRRAAIAALALALAGTTTAAAGETIFRLDDARGDDHGAGRLLYPRTDDYEPGELDLLSFAARPGNGGTWFDATFARPVRPPDARGIDALGTPLASVAKLGFFTFNLDVYVDRDRQPGSGALLAMPGRQLQLPPADAWDRAIVLTPQPHAARALLKTVLDRQLRQELREEAPAVTPEQAAEMRLSIPADVEQRVFFPTLVRVRGAKVSFFVPEEFLGGPARADWGYAVAVTGADLVQSYDLQAKVGLADAQQASLMNLPVGSGTRFDRFGGAWEDDELMPPVVDVLLPADMRQDEVLRSHDSRGGVLATVPAVVPARAAP